MNRLLLGKDLEDIINHIIFGYITELDYEDGYYLERCLKDYEERIAANIKFEAEGRVDEFENEVSDLENEIGRLEGLLEENEIEY